MGYILNNFLNNNTMSVDKVIQRIENFQMVLEIIIYNLEQK